MKFFSGQTVVGILAFVATVTGGFAKMLFPFDFPKIDVKERSCSSLPRTAVYW